MIKETKAFTVQCDECRGYVETSRRKPKLFESKASAAEEAHSKGWLCIIHSGQWLCPKCHNCNRITTSYVY